MSSLSDQVISPAFEPFLAESDADDKREAIVIYRAPSLAPRKLRERLRQLKQRLDNVKRQAAAQVPVRKALLDGYQRAAPDDRVQPKPLQVPGVGASALGVETVEVTAASLPALAAQPNVVAIMPNQRISLIEPKEVDYVALSRREASWRRTWGLEQLEIPTMWETTRGSDVGVAVLDTGVYANHPCLTGRLRDFVVIDPLGRRVKAEPAFDCGQHGTHVCGTIAGGETPSGVAVGVAPDVGLYVAGVLMGGATLRSLLEGMSWAVEQGVDVISLSLGFTYYEPLFAEVFSILIDQFGVLPVVAIGNENHGNTSSPGNVHNAFSIGAIERSEDRVEVASFSGGASLVFPGQQQSTVTKPDVVAPGVGVYSCVPPQKHPKGVFDYTYMDGTSMATPHVAGVAALLMSAKPAAPVTDIVSALRETAGHPGGPELRPDNRWGFGVVNPVAALKALG